MNFHLRSILKSKCFIWSCQNGKATHAYSRLIHLYPNPTVNRNQTRQHNGFNGRRNLILYSTKVKHQVDVGVCKEIGDGNTRSTQPVTQVINFKLPESENNTRVLTNKTNSLEEKQNVYSDKNTKLKWVKLKPDLYTLEVDFQDTVKTVEVAKTNEKKSVFVEFPEKSEIIQINLDPVHKLIDDTNPAKNVESIKELAWTELQLDSNKLPLYYMNLSKIRLTGLVVLTTMAGYAMAPCAFSFTGFLLCSSGTALTSCAANAMNQGESLGSLLNRTYWEFLHFPSLLLTGDHVCGVVREQPSAMLPLHAVSFSVITSAVGLTVLFFAVNPLTAALGAFNLGLYTLAYTPMKRYSIANTWVGSIVGAIPPVMGWTAATGVLEPGALLLGTILYAWQFPHFNALSWNLRPDYSRGGYRMASVINPDLCKRVALRHSIAMIPLCFLPPMMGMTTWIFAIDSLPLNLYLTFLAWNFYRKGDSNSSRKLFRFTLIHIPLLLVLMIASKNYNEIPESDKKLVVAVEK